MIPRRSSGSSRGQRRRADEIAEHHGQLSPLGFRRGPENRDGHRRTKVSTAKHGYGVEQPTAVADRGYPDVLEVLVRQRREDRSVDVVFAENRLVLPEAQISQPAEDIHGASRFFA